MPRLAALSRSLRGQGREESAVMDVPLGTNMFTLRLPRISWPVRAGVGKDGEIVEAFVLISFDGGRAWPYLRGFGTHGGDYINRRGDLVVENTLRPGEPVPEPDNPNRKVKVILDRYGDVDTRADLDWETV